MSSVSRTDGLHVSLLVDEDRPALAELLDGERQGTLYLRSLVHEFGLSPTDRQGHGRFFGAGRAGVLDGVAFLGNSRNITTHGSVAAVEAALDRMLTSGGSPRLFVGPAAHAGLIRRVFSRAAVVPYLDRAQAYLVLEPENLLRAEDDGIRPAVADELREITVAHAAMTEEDLAIPRAHLDMARMRELSRGRIEAGKVWVVMKGGRLVFKTEEVARSGDGVLVGGVYTDPAFRGRGYATRGIAAWARRLINEQGLRFLALHVNADNTPAVRAYERVGFRPHSMLRLMLAY